MPFQMFLQALLVLFLAQQLPLLLLPFPLQYFPTAPYILLSLLSILLD
jgi:hypothetical protein